MEITNTSSTGATPMSHPADTKLSTSVQLEMETLQRSNGQMTFRQYLESGYKHYRHWLGMTLGGAYTQHLNFCVARNLNVTSKTNAMGVDLEIRYVLKKLENLFGFSQMKSYEEVISKTLKQNFQVSDIHIKSILDSYQRNPQSYELMLTDAEFQQRVANVPTEVLDTHSFSCWRNSNHAELNSTPYQITRDDIMNGESLCPPSARHIGLQMLQINGLMPEINNPKQSKQHAVTFAI